MPFARALSMTPRVSSSDWTRLIALWTSGSKSWMPIEMRLKPRLARTSTCSRVVTRGSTSIETSAPAARSKRDVIAEKRRSSWEGRGSWRPAAPVELLDRSLLNAGALDEAELVLDGVEVAIASFVRAGDLHAAPAEQAQLRAVGDVRVERDGLVRPRSGGRLEALPVGLRVEGQVGVLLPVHRGGIGGVARR